MIRLQLPFPPTTADVVDLAKRRAAEMEATFPKFTRMSWEQQTLEAQKAHVRRALEELQVVL